MNAMPKPPFSRLGDLARSKRPLLGTLAILVVLACVRIATAFIAITPRLGVELESERDSAFALVGRILTGRGFSPWVPTLEDRPESRYCFNKGDVILCGETTQREIHFALTEMMASSLSVGADSLRRELVDSVRVRFGAPQVRECRRRDEKKVLSRCTRVRK